MLSHSQLALANQDPTFTSNYIPPSQHSHYPSTTQAQNNNTTMAIAYSPIPSPYRKIKPIKWNITVEN
jgi:hypothetical protein